MQAIRGFLMTLIFLPSISHASALRIEGFFNSESAKVQIIALDYKTGTAAVSLIATAPGCYSRVSGIGTLKGRSLKFSPVSDTDAHERCEVEFIFDDRWENITVFEDNCTRYRVEKCPFNGQSISRQKIPGEQSTPVQASNSPGTAAPNNPQQAKFDAISITGKYSFPAEPSSKTPTIELECESEKECTLTTLPTSRKSESRPERKTLNKVLVTGGPGGPVQARNALAYAIKERYKNFQNAEFAATMEYLNPILSGQPFITKCWDFNYPAPDYMLACRLAGQNGKPLSELFLFGTLLANCGEAFCRYVITPLSASK